MPDITPGQVPLDHRAASPREEDLGSVQAIVAQVKDGFSIAVDLRRAERHDMWRVNFVTGFAEAENVAKAFALQHGVPWERVEVVLTLAG